MIVPRAASRSAQAPIKVPKTPSSPHTYGWPVRTSISPGWLWAGRGSVAPSPRLPAILCPLGGRRRAGDPVRDRHPSALRRASRLAQATAVSSRVWLCGQVQPGSVPWYTGALRRRRLDRQTVPPTLNGPNRCTCQPSLTSMPPCLLLDVERAGHAAATVRSDGVATSVILAPGCDAAPIHVVCHQLPSVATSTL